MTEELKILFTESKVKRLKKNNILQLDHITNYENIITSVLQSCLAF